MKPSCVAVSAMLVALTASPAFAEVPPAAVEPLTPEANINGSIYAIAGILNERGNVLGMMPHPENHVEADMGCTDGRGLFAGLIAHVALAA